MASISQPVAITTFAILIFTCLLGLCIAIYALWQIFSKNAKELQNVDKITVYTAASCIVLHALTGTLDPLAYYFAVVADQQQTGSIVLILWDAFWTLSKLNLYFVYIYRCYITFKHTKYAHSAIKVYIPLAFAWILQLFNGVIFVYHKLDDADLLPDSDNPLSSDDAVLIASYIYLVLDIIIVLSVVFLFLNPLIKLMADLRSKSQKLLSLHSAQSAEHQQLTENMANGDAEIELVNNDMESSNSSSSPITPTTPHSPTKLGAAYYYKSNKKRNKGAIAVPTTSKHQYSNTETEVTMTSVDTVFKTKKFERLPCPEDAYDEKEMENLQPLKMSKKFKGIIWNKKQNKILETGTRLALLSVIALSSGLLYQCLWIISVTLNTLGYFTYTWGFDTVINIACIYLSFHFAVKEYDILCSKCCHCHGCCLKCVDHMARKRVA